jgi:hypothetical protein
MSIVRRATELGESARFAAFERVGRAHADASDAGD